MDIIDDLKRKSGLDVLEEALKNERENMEKQIEYLKSENKRLAEKLECIRK